MYYMNWEIDEDGKEPIELCIGYTVTPGRPAKLNALPEDCYPEESAEVEIGSVCLKAYHNHVDPPQFDLTDEQVEAIEEYVLENPPERDY